MTCLSCHRFRSNQVLLWLSLLAYNLGNLRRLASEYAEIRRRRRDIGEVASKQAASDLCLVALPGIEPGF
jgi:hypothetical protein